MTSSASADPATLVALLDDPWCRQLVLSLVLNDVRLGDLAALAGARHDVVTARLQPLCAAGVITERGSDANPTDVYYHLNLDTLRALYARSGAAVPPELAPVVAEAETPHLEGRDARPRVLFLCTHNSARSQLAEGLMRLLSKGQVAAFSAGNQPASVHPLALEILAGLKLDVSAQHSKHLEAFLGQDFDYVITVCDRAREICPAFPGARRSIHWSISDPAEVEGRAAQARAFHQAMNDLRTRITYLLIFIERERHEQRAVGQTWT